MGILPILTTQKKKKTEIRRKKIWLRSELIQERFVLAGFWLDLIDLDP